MRLLLISNSTGAEGGYLDHCEREIRSFLAGTSRVLFVPFALHDESGYGDTTCTRLQRMGITAEWADRAGDPTGQLAGCDAVFVGGGNTFRLLDRLYSTGMLEALRVAVLDGMRYVGSSAGSNVAGPTIKTTNDMPIVQPPSFEALGLVSFQINPHYVDRDPDSTHRGETREQRLTEYLEENTTPVVALREGAMLHIEEGTVTVAGSSGARVYRRDAPVAEVAPGSRIDSLVSL